MTRRNWVAVASVEHVALGVEQGIMQVCHGKRAPLARVQGGDRIVYYSPVQRFGERDACQAFTALGIVRNDEVYAHDMGGGFVPYRKDVDYRRAARAASIRPLLQHLSFTRGRSNWGMAFRYGLLEISDADLDCIAAAMGAAPLCRVPARAELLAPALGA